MGNSVTAPSPLDQADDPPISRIACLFGQEILFSAAMDMSDWAASHASSAATAAWRGDVAALGAHLRQASNAIQAALMTFDAIEGEKAKAADTELAPT